MPYWQNPHARMTPVGFGGGVSPVKQQGSVTPGGVAVWHDEGVLVDGSAPGGLVTDAPLTGGPFARQGGAWIPITGGDSGTLTSITAGTGLTGGTITTSGTIALATPVSLANGGTGVSAGSATAALTALGGAPLNSAALTGTPTLVTPPAGTDDSNALATTAWVTSKLASATAGVSQITVTTPLNASAATGNVALTLGTVPVASGGTGATTAAAGLAALGGAPLLSPPLTGVPTAPTATAGTNTIQIATTAFVKAAVDAIDALPTGGAQYDVLSKASATSGDVEWRGAGVRPNNNTVIGAGAFGTGTGSNSVAIGTNALAASGAANFNVAIGHNAAPATSGSGVVAVGRQALNTATAGNFLVAIGDQVMRFANGTATAGAVAVGSQALQMVTVLGAGGSNDVAVGSGTLGALVTSGRNAALGANAGAQFGPAATPGNLTASTTSVFIGADSRAAADNEINQIVIGASAFGHGSDTITLGNEGVTALYTRAGLVLGDDPTGGAKGPGTINTTDAIYTNNVKLGGFAPSIAWTADTDPDGISMFLNNTGRVLNIAAISGIVEKVNGSPATVTVVKAASGTALSAGAGTPVHGAPFDADLNAGSTQDITPFLGMTLGIGERLGLQATAINWLDSVASITVYLEP